MPAPTTEQLERIQTAALTFAETLRRALGPAVQRLAHALRRAMRPNRRARRAMRAGRADKAAWYARDHHRRRRQATKPHI